MPKILIDGMPLLDDELERSIRIIEEYADAVEKNEPYATESIRVLRSAASSIPRDVASWVDEYPA